MKQASQISARLSALSRHSGLSRLFRLSRPSGLSRLSRLVTAAERIDAATPAHRDRAIDALRAVAILGVILGHWAVTALVVRDAGAGETSAAHVHGAGPLAYMPDLAPVSWVLQTLAVFFFVGGYANTRSLRRPYGGWAGARLRRLYRPVAVLLVAWVPVALLLMAADVPIAAPIKLLVSPLWFLGVYAVLTALTPWLRALRPGPYAAIVPLVVVVAVDALRFGPADPAVPGSVGLINVFAGWLVPYLLGMAWADGALASRRVAYGLLAVGAGGTAALIIWAGYPASMVGVPGAEVSNLNPPTLAAVTFGIAQVGLALLLYDRLVRWMRRPVLWASVVLANLSAMTLFCWHQSALMLVTLVGYGAGPLPGLHDVPDQPGWIAYRLAWLPVFALTLTALWTAFHRFEHPPTPRRS